MLFIYIAISLCLCICAYIYIIFIIIGIIFIISFIIIESITKMKQCAHIFLYCFIHILPYYFIGNPSFYYLNYLRTKQTSITILLIFHLIFYYFLSDYQFLISMLIYYINRLLLLQFF